MIGLYLVLLILLIFIVLMMDGCGARKTNTSIQKGSSKENTGVQIGSQSETISVITTQDEVFNQNKKSNETSETIINKKYDKDTGVLIESTETSKKGLESDNGWQRNVRTTKSYVRTIDRLSIVVKTIHETKYYEKNKNTEVSNSKFYWMIFGVLVILILIYFLYRYLKDIAAKKAALRIVK